jgi:hypothetical protein
MMEARQRSTAFSHAVAEKLPRAIICVVRYVCDRLFALQHCLREIDASVWWIGKSPIRKFGIFVTSVDGFPKLLLDLGEGSVRLHKWLRESTIESFILRKSIFEIWIYSLQNRIIRSVVIPICPVH